MKSQRHHICLDPAARKDGGKCHNEAPLGCHKRRVMVGNWFSCFDSIKKKKKKLLSAEFCRCEAGAGVTLSHWFYSSYKILDSVLEDCYFLLLLHSLSLLLSVIFRLRSTRDRVSFTMIRLPSHILCSRSSSPRDVIYEMASKCVLNRADLLYHTAIVLLLVRITPPISVTFLNWRGRSSLYIR